MEGRKNEINYLPLKELRPNPATIHTCGFFNVLSERQADEMLSEKVSGSDNSNRTASPE